MKPQSRVDFAKLAAEVRRAQCGRADLTILGGRCTESDLSRFLEQWDIAGMPYRIWEYASEIVLEQNTTPHNIALLERARLFGPRGDLMLRRDGADFDWRFIGPAGVKPPAGNHYTQDYWENHPMVTFHQYEEAALLWGKWNGQYWTDDRVAAAKLDYPAEGQRIELLYKAFSRAGQVEFVWYTGLSEWEEGHNG